MAAASQAPLADFSIDPKRLGILSACAAVVGVVAAFLAKVLLLLVGFITHVAYFGTTASGLAQPDPRRIGPLAILIPAAGGVIVGLIARFGSDKIRGHGIPEAIQSILERDSIIQARVAFWKPLASAIAIGTGSPFGAEGPIIMTGGAFGSLFGQYLHLSSMERRTVLVAGAAGGMAATFGAPIASVLIAVELLLFEWRPRSFIPVAIAAFVADLVRIAIIGPTPTFEVTVVHNVAASTIPWAALIGIAGGVVSMLMTRLVYWTEDAYARLPLHWMWWPAIGGAIAGVGGWFVPAALGVGYPSITAMANGRLAIGTVAALVGMKIVIWIASLSSGTSGGVLAPLLMIGAALGALLAPLIPGHDASTWAIVGMAALMGGTMRAPIMGTFFALETTHAWNLAPDVFVGCVAATAFTVLFVPRSILTEKLARRGMHVAREYMVHPLESVAARDVMAARRPDEKRPAAAIRFDDRARRAMDVLAHADDPRVAIVDERGEWVGTVTVEGLFKAWRQGTRAEARRRRVRRLRRSKRLTPNG
jgi:CIC family chloride channel protein